MKRFIPAIVFLLVLSASLTAQQRPDALELYRQGQYDQAVKACLQELEDWDIGQNKLRMNSYSVLGWSYLRMGRYDEALSMARKARQESRYDSRIIEIQAEALYYLGQNTEALKLFEEYVSLPGTGDRVDLVYYFMGEIFIRLAEYHHAYIAFSTALHHNPQAARWWARLGYTSEQLKDTKGAETAYNKALELQPALEEARVGLERIGS
ncbi:MAG: hypothetical protein CSA76_02695 [Spirochaetales bacterium]|nr:MAG: hypothetical protein CSA76_02695 [Spirochaetales bacterium]